MRYRVGALLLLSAMFAVSSQGKNPDRVFLLLRFVDSNVSIFISGEDDLSAVHVKGTGTEFSADCKKKTLELSGTGEVLYKNHKFTFSGKSLTFDGKALSANSRNFVLSTNGELTEGFIRTFDREPHTRSKDSGEPRL